MFSRVLLSIQQNQIKSIRAQEQVASGRRLLRPSDDPTGAARALSLTRQIADVDRFHSAISSGRTVVDTATAGLQNASNLLSEARQLLIESMNGTLSPGDREALSVEFDLLRTQLMEIGNLRTGDRYLFAGTDSGQPPWVTEGSGDHTRVVYRGNEESQFIRIGEGVDIPINLPGSEVFGRMEFTGTNFAELTGVASGLTADEGLGYEYLDFRHDSTSPGTLGTVGIALVNGGADDSLLGDAALNAEAGAGTTECGTGRGR